MSVTENVARPGIRFFVWQVVITLVAIYVVLEVWARVFPPKDQTVWPSRNVPQVGTTFEPNSRVVLSNGLDFRTEQRSNEAGFLDRPLPPIAKPAGSCRIAFIGDSFIEAAQVAIDQKVQVVTQRLLEARQIKAGRPARPVETMGFGFSGTGQLNQLGYFDAYVRPREPDLIVLVFVSNDFANNSSLLESIRVGWHPAHTPRIFARETSDGRIELQPTDANYMSYRLPAAKDERPWLHARLYRASRFYRWLYAKLLLQYPTMAHRLGQEPTEADRTSARLAGIAALDPTYARDLAGWDPKTSPGIDAMFNAPDPLPPAFAQALRFTAFALDEFKSKAAADGARLVVLGTHEMPGFREDRLKRILAERQIPYISLAEHIQKHANNIEDAHFPHDGHWSVKGHVWAAEAVVDYMAASNTCAVGR